MKRNLHDYKNYVANRVQRRSFAVLQGRSTAITQRVGRQAEIEPDVARNIYINTSRPQTKFDKPETRKKVPGA